MPNRDELFKKCLYGAALQFDFCGENAVFLIVKRRAQAATHTTESFMSKLPPGSSKNRSHPGSWRDYQTTRQSENGFRRPRRSFPLRAVIFVTTLLLALSVLYDFFPANGAALFESSKQSPAPAAKTFSKEELRQLLDDRAFSNLTGKQLTIPAAGQTLQVETTLDPGLQGYLLETIDPTYARYVGIVVMEANTGRVLALAGFDRTDPGANPCLNSRFPAASIFKIVTAATAVDLLGYSADSPVSFNGPKHTLYKRQLTDKVDRYTDTLPLREAFAESVNPVFGKLGELRLRKPLLEKAADNFGFNRPLDFELPLSPSHFHVSDEPYNWAEIASGFNLDTTLSPLHGAVLAAAVVNAGRMVTPSIVEHVSDAQGNSLYTRTDTDASWQIMSPRAAVALGQMMETTVTSGTARKAFRKSQQDRVLSRLQIGGKTGSIDNQSHDVRFDWFVGFARERQGRKQIAIAVLVGHEKFIGVRAGDYARQAFTYYFGNSSVQSTSQSRVARTATRRPAGAFRPT